MAKVLTGLVRATSTLTIEDNCTADNTVTIGAVVYTFKASPSSAYEVDIGGTATVSLANLVKAINASGVSGTDYGASTLAHPAVEAVSSNATTLVVKARAPGLLGNQIATAETWDGTASWTGSYLAAGAGNLQGLLTTVLTTMRDATQAKAENEQTITDILADLAA